MYENFGNFLMIIFTMKIFSFLRKNGLEYGIRSETTETRHPRVRRRKPRAKRKFWRVAGNSLRNANEGALLST